MEKKNLVEAFKANLQKVDVEEGVRIKPRGMFKEALESCKLNKMWHPNGVIAEVVFDAGGEVEIAIEGDFHAEVYSDAGQLVRSYDGHLEDDFIPDDAALAQTLEGDDVYALEIRDENRIVARSKDGESMVLDDRIDNAVFTVSAYRSLVDANAESAEFIEEPEADELEEKTESEEVSETPKNASPTNLSNMESLEEEAEVESEPNAEEDSKEPVKEEPKSTEPDAPDTGDALTRLPLDLVDDYLNAKSDASFLGAITCFKRKGQAGSLLAAGKSIAKEMGKDNESVMVTWATKTEDETSEKSVAFHLHRAIRAYFLGEDAEKEGIILSCLDGARVATMHPERNGFGPDANSTEADDIPKGEGRFDRLPIPVLDIFKDCDAEDSMLRELAKYQKDKSELHILDAANAFMKEVGWSKEDAIREWAVALEDHEATDAPPQKCLNDATRFYLRYKGMDEDAEKKEVARSILDSLLSASAIGLSF